MSFVYLHFFYAIFIYNWGLLTDILLLLSGWDDFGIIIIKGLGEGELRLMFFVFVGCGEGCDYCHV